MNDKINNSGLLPLPKDDRDFNLGAVFFLPDLEDLPEGFRLKQFKIKHQGDSDLCTAFSVTGASELEEGVELSPEYQFAKTKEISGDILAWGADLRQACKSAVKFGSIEQKDNPNKLEAKGRDYVANSAHYEPNLDTLAEEHKKRSYFRVEGKYDTFDAIRASIWKFREQKQAVVLGLVWSWDLDEKFLTMKNAKGGKYGHAMFAIGWETVGGETYLVVQNSYGKRAGDDGVHYISREVINQDVARFGSFMLVDMPRDKAEYLLDNGIKEGDSWIVGLWKVFTNLIKSLWTGKKN